MHNFIEYVKNIELSDWIALIALIIAVPAMIISIHTSIKNKFNLSCYFQITEKVDLYEDINDKTPSDFWRLCCSLSYINYAPIDFFINKIDLRIGYETFAIEQFNSNSDQLMRIDYPIVPFKNIPLYQRASGEIKLTVDLPKSINIAVGKIYLYTSYRKRPYKYAIHDSIQSQQPPL